MPDWIYASKDISASAKLLMERIFSLSKDGSQQVYIKRSTFSAVLGINESTLTRNFKELIDLGLIEEISNTNPFDKTKNFLVTQKACSDRLLQNATIENSKMPRSSIAKCQDRALQNAKIEIAKMQRSSSDRNIDRNIDIGASAHTQEKTQNSSASVKYPQSVEEVEILFNEHIQKWTSEKPEIKNINVKYESSLFLDYWQSANWKRKGKAVKSVKGAVATWIANASRNFGYRPRQTHKTAQEIEQFAQGVQELVDQQYNAFNSNNNISDAEVVDIKDVSEIENLFLETKTK